MELERWLEAGPWRGSAEGFGGRQEHEPAGDQRQVGGPRGSGCTNRSRRWNAARRAAGQGAEAGAARGVDHEINVAVDRGEELVDPCKVVDEQHGDEELASGRLAVERLAAPQKGRPAGRWGDEEAVGPRSSWWLAGSTAGEWGSRGVERSRLRRSSWEGAARGRRGGGYKVRRRPREGKVADARRQARGGGR